MIIDFRFRSNTIDVLENFYRVFEKAINAMGMSKAEYLAQAQTIEEIVDGLQRNHVVKAVIVGRDIETTFSIPNNNDEVRAFCEQYPNLFCGFVGADPHKEKHTIKDITHRIKNEGFSGVAIDPLHARIQADDEKYYPIYSECCNLNVPIIITGGPARFTKNTLLRNCHPEQIDRIANDFPALKIVISHGAWPFVNEMIGVSYRHTNVYMELSEYELFPQSNSYLEAANTILKERILFASAHPGVNYKKAIELYEKLPLHDDVRENIMWKNAKSFLEKVTLV